MEVFQGFNPALSWIFRFVQSCDHNSWNSIFYSATFIHYFLVANFKQKLKTARKYFCHICNAVKFHDSPPSIYVPADAPTKFLTYQINPEIKPLLRCAPYTYIRTKENMVSKTVFSHHQTCRNSSWLGIEIVTITTKSKGYKWNRKKVKSAERL